MRSIRISIIGIFMLSFMWAQNPIQNPGFETGDMTNWESASGGGYVKIDSTGGKTGSYSLEVSVAASDNWTVAFQKVKANYNIGDKAVLSAYIRDIGDSLAGGDFAGLKMEFWSDDEGKLVEKEVFQTGVTASWQEFSLEYLVPYGTDSIAAVLVAVRWDGSGHGAFYGFDDVELTFEAGESPDVASNVTVVFEDFDVLDTAWAMDGEGSLTATLDNADYAQGYGAVDVKYVIPALHSWGSFVAYQNMPDENAASFDISIGETLSVWLKVEEAPARPDTMLFRIQLTDLPPGAAAHEMYAYENLTALDSVRDWFEIKAPLVQRETDGATIPNEEGFVKVPNDWGQPANDEILNFESIRSIEFDFVTSGWDPNANIPADSGKVSIDYLTLKGNKGVDVTFFNGLTLSALASETFGWGQSTLEVIPDSGYEEGLNALKWVQGDEWGNGWSGAGFNLAEKIDYTPRWFKDSLKFHMYTDANTPSLKFQFESGSDGKAFYDMTPEAAGGWNYYTLALEDFVLDSEAPNFDTSAVSVLGFMANGNAVAGRTILFGSIVTGNPPIDVTAPAAPTSVDASLGTYYNIVTWDDVAGETGEIYNVYASKWPIDSLTQSTVDVVASGVLESTQSATHLLYNPVEDAAVGFYYAVECIDASGNVSVFGVTESAISNTARGIPTISLTVPDVTIDADLSEWFESDIEPFYIGPDSNSWGTPQVSIGTVDDAVDASATFFVAMDTSYLFVAGEITDNSYEGWTGTGNWWEYDVFEFFIGLFDQRGKRLSSIGDYHFKLVFSENKLHTELASNYSDTTGSVMYIFEGFNPDYAFEAMIPLDSLTGDNAKFKPVNGYRIIMEPTIHDRDNAAHEGNVAASTKNADNAWSDAAVWSYSWLGDRDGTLDISTPVKNVPLSYGLNNNYPNPFNPATKIQYTIPVSGKIRLTVFNVLGEEVMTLVDDVKPAGVHTVQFNGRNLASGIYFYRLETSNFVKSKKMLLLK